MSLPVRMAFLFYFNAKQSAITRNFTGCLYCNPYFHPSKTTTMPSFDIVSKVDPQTVENAINVAKKEIANRYDFHGSHTEIDLNKKDLTVQVTTENEMRIKAVMDIIVVRGSKQGIDPRSYDLSKEPYPSGATVKQDIKLKNGLDKDAMRKIVKAIKDTGLKVQASQMDNMVRVTGKKIDDLQEIMAALRKGDYGYPLQFENMKS
jgi:uncharacterized protein YajQ (UPF0234 family)